MTRPRTALTCCVLALVAAGCGIRPTDVTDGGTAPSGISKGMRIYFASDNGPRGVPRPEVTFDQLDDAFKLLIAGPSPAERADGLTNLLPTDVDFSADAVDGEVTIAAPGYPTGSSQDQATGQLVCTLARAEVLVHGTRPDKVQVVIAGDGERVGPYRCQQFLQR
ncbi:GerMN domain-containing protein [Streptomyces decoyicus]|uniref:GerMN domain-containing protein n=1 Tax=Streptomyces decoyicus TaxID=249567 RepID=UPI002E31B646|nr:GerMN domain-containing protein [Streptomyces decoyicus]